MKNKKGFGCFVVVISGIVAVVVAISKFNNDRSKEGLSTSLKNLKKRLLSN